MIVWKCHSFFFFKQKTAYEMRISDWSSDVCSSDLPISRTRSGQAQPPTGKFLLFARQVHLFRTGSVRIQKILRKRNHLWATGIEQRSLHHMTRKNDPQRGSIGGHLTQMRPRDRCGVIRNKTAGLEIHDMHLRFGNAETIDCTSDDLLPHNGGDGRFGAHVRRSTEKGREGKE